MARRIRIPHFARIYEIPCTAYSFRVLSSTRMARDKHRARRSVSSFHRSIDHCHLGVSGRNVDEIPSIFSPFHR